MQRLEQHRFETSDGLVIRWTRLEGTRPGSEEPSAKAEEQTSETARPTQKWFERWLDCMVHAVVDLGGLG